MKLLIVQGETLVIGSPIIILPGSPKQYVSSLHGCNVTGDFISVVSNGAGDFNLFWDLFLFTFIHLSLYGFVWLNVTRPSFSTKVVLGMSVQDPISMIRWHTFSSTVHLEWKRYSLWRCSSGCGWVVKTRWMTRSSPESAYVTYGDCSSGHFNLGIHSHFVLPG